MKMSRRKDIHNGYYHVSYCGRGYHCTERSLQASNAEELEELSIPRSLVISSQHIRVQYCLLAVELTEKLSYSAGCTSVGCATSSPPGGTAIPSGPTCIQMRIMFDQGFHLINRYYNYSHKLKAMSKSFFLRGGGRGVRKP